ncbi:hypothetical protein JCM8547_007981 [Rhodosporidiobolus lusitaniae]
MSLFRKKKSSAKLKADPSPSLSLLPSPPIASTAPRRPSLNAPLVPTASTSSYGLAGLADSLPSVVHVDDFGRVIQPLPAFAASGANGGLPFGSGYGVGDDYDGQPQEMQLLYGYAPLATTTELSVEQVEFIVSRCATEIRQRGLDIPLILSSMALDLELEGVCSLIRAYLDSPQAWAQDLNLAAPLSIGAFLKWALARGTRGFVSWDSYTDFKMAERATGFQPRSCSVHLISRLPVASGGLLSTLLSFFSSVTAWSATNGMLPRRLAALFSPYIFGLPDDRSFDETYLEWQKATDAVEHILLSFIKEEKANGPLPTFLEKFIAGYPSQLNVSYTGAAPKIPKGARVEEVTRVKRLSRFHSRNLIQSAGTWEVPHSASWQLFFDPSSSSSTPVYTASYRHLLNIRANHGLEDGAPACEDEGELQRYRSRVEKEWGTFGQTGFGALDSSKLEFDLTESERAPPLVKRETMDWSTFETSGFSGRDIFQPSDLVFHSNLTARVNTWPASQKALSDKLRAAEQLLPAFPHDTTAREEGRVLVERDFFEAWADVLVGGGWSRDELKEASFALLNWKARPRDGGKVGGDPRTEERWVLVEEFVPREYREALLADPKTKVKQSKRVSFLRAVRRKSSAPPPSSPSSRPSTTAQASFSSLVPAPLSSSYARKDSNLRPIDEAVYNSDTTQKLSLSNLHVDRTSYSKYAPSTSYAPSIVSTVRAADGHGPAYSTQDLPGTADVPPLPAPSPSPGRGVGVSGTLSSQQRESAFGGNGVPTALGYQKPPLAEKKSSFLFRIGTMRPGKSPSPVVTTAPELLAGTYAATAPAMQEYPRPPVSSRVPLSPGREQVSNGVAVPINGTGGYYDGAVLPGAPPLAPVVESPRYPQHETTPPLPPKENGASLHLVQTPVQVERSRVDSESNRTAVSEDPYGGMRDDETEDNHEDGEVLFRGSRSFPNDLNVQAGQPPPGRTIETVEEEEPGSPRPPRSHSLQPQQHYEQELPVDELEPPHFPHQDRYLSGTSQFSSRVNKIINMYEQQQEPDVRLTQYGFNERSAVHP